MNGSEVDPIGRRGLGGTRVDGLRVVVVGGGFAGLSAAACLARSGASVTLLEKNPRLGGRARVWERDGFRFDMGPSWYWMPDVFERFFGLFGRRVDEFYGLERLDPSYRVVFGPGDAVDVPAGIDALVELFEATEPGAGRRLGSFLADAAYKYERGMGEFVRKPSLSIREFADPTLLWALVRLQMLQSFRRHVQRHFTDPRLRQIVEFPVLFLGATAPKTPALFSLMNHADMALGTWYPEGGMGAVVGGLARLAEEEGAELVRGAAVRRIVVEGGRVVGVEVGREGAGAAAEAAFRAGERDAVRRSGGEGTPADVERIPADVVLASADYHHVEQSLLRPEHRQYSPRYWRSRTLSPSSLLFYLGVRGRVEGLEHHTLFFDEDLDAHARAIYETPRWPERPLFYVSAPSRTDPGVAPDGHENLCLLIPLAPDLADPEETRERYYRLVMERLERHAGHAVRDRVVLKRSYAHSDFRRDYHALGGNAYGLANTLRQTALLRPRLRSKAARGLYFAGQLTVPGPGVPPAVVSGEVAARQIAADVGGRG